MAISIDWGNTYVISVPQADLTLVSGSLYELDVDAFRLELKSLEDDPAGMPYPRTHNHNTALTVAGTTFARTVEILSPYSVEFEDGQYSVRLVGANNNIFDVEAGILVQNQVQVIPTNSAGLITTVVGSGLSLAEQQMLLELWQDRGFDSGNPLTVDESAGTVTVAGIVRQWTGNLIKTFTRQ